MPIHSIQKISKVPLREIWKKEDKDFSKWLEEHIDYLTECIGFDISIESREENVGPFRVDLYGEDVDGHGIIIENQLEKSDHGHLGQIITYLTNLEAKTAIWIVKEPTKEHARAIEWLNETTPDDISFYLIKLEAIKIGDATIAAPLFTIIERPTTERKSIGSERKEQAQRHIVRVQFWSQFLEKAIQKHSIFANTTAGTESWIGAGLGKAGISLNLVVTKSYARSEVFINRGSAEENKRVFDLLYKFREEIEHKFGGELVWERNEDIVTSRIKKQLEGVNLFNEEDWFKMNEFLIDVSERMHRAFKEVVSRLP